MRRKEICPWILSVSCVLAVGCGGATNGGTGSSGRPGGSQDAGEDSGDGAARAVCDTASASSCIDTGRIVGALDEAAPCEWNAAASKYCGGTSSVGPLWRCGSYTALAFTNVDVADYFFYDAAGTLVGEVHILGSGTSACTSYAPSFVPPPPHDPNLIDFNLVGCVPLFIPCTEDAGGAAP